MLPKILKNFNAFVDGNIFEWRNFGVVGLRFVGIF